MSQSFFDTWVGRVLSDSSRGLRRQERRSSPGLFPRVESLETRALLATVTVNVINFAFTPDPVQIHLGDTIHWVWDTDNHSTTSVAGSAESWDSGVHNTGFTFDHTFTHLGTFVYYCTIHGHDNGNGTASGMSGEIAVVPVTTLNSIAVTPANPSIAAGTTEQFMATGTYSDGTTQNLTSQVTWASANTSVATISNASGSQGKATAVAPGTSAISATLNSVTGSTVLTASAPLVTLTDVHLVFNKRHLVTQIIVSFSGAVNVAEADSVATYRLATAGRKGSFDAKNAMIIKLRSTILAESHNSFALTPRKPFALSKTVQLRVNGLPPAGLQDSLGRLIDGNHDGQPGGNAIALLRRNGVIVS